MPLRGNFSDEDCKTKACLITLVRVSIGSNSTQALRNSKEQGMKFSLFDVIQEAKAFDGSLQGESKGKVDLKNNRYLSLAKIAPVKPNGEVLSI